MSAPLIVYVTAPDNQVAEKIAMKLLEERLIACANLLPGMLSHYRWNDRLESSKEIVLILKTTDKLFETAKARILELHPYDLPCILGWPATKLHEPYYQWIRDSVEKRKTHDKE